jgi:D-cysteine desulfhydrase
LFVHVPRLASEISVVDLGTLPTRVEPLSHLIPEFAKSEGYVKRDDQSADVYGGNKVRTLEFLFGQALRQGAQRIYSTGAFGSNHAAATVLHAERVGLQSGAILFPQPPSGAARENFALVMTRAHDAVLLPHWSVLPLGVAWAKQRGGARVSVMAPGGAVPLGALGYVSAALELAEQVASGELPAPRRIVLGVGSTCTSAGLLVGLRVARALGLAFRARLPEVVAVRVSPWPVTSPRRIAWLAYRTSQLLSRLARDARFAFSFAELASGLRLDPRFIGSGYGRVTNEGLDAIRRFANFGAHGLDTTYSAKSAAGFLRALSESSGPTLYWATKSSRPLPAPDPSTLDGLPRAARRFLARCRGADGLVRPAR